MDQIVSKGVGIDLGTTNSAVAVMDLADTKIELYRDAASKSPTTPSCVWKNPGTGEIVVGRKAATRVGTAPAPIRSVKRLMGSRETVMLTDEEVTPEEVSAQILREMRRQIEQTVATFNTAETLWTVDRAIVTIPAYFDQPQIDATRTAAELAGLDLIDLLHEPTAAACYHCWRSNTTDGTFLVYDLGGGTFDVSVLRCTAGAFEVLGISGNTRLGGDDIDNALATELQQRLCKEGYALHLDLKNDPEDRIRFSQLKFMAERVKKTLSSETEYLLTDSGSIKDKEGTVVLVESMWERAELEAIAQPLIERTLPYCHKALEIAHQQARITLADVDEIILAGGSTHIPLVRQLVTAELCGSLNVSGRARCAEPVYQEVDTIVALGAAIRSAASGGLAIYDPDRTVRVSFRGTGSTAREVTNFGGKVEAVTGEPCLTGGEIRMIAEDYTDEAELGPGGSFAFTDVPVSPGAENTFTFEVFDANGRRVATVGRQVTPVAPENVRPMDASGRTNKQAKSLALEIAVNGKSQHEELFPALVDLPATKDFQFRHPGDTELVLLPLYENRKHIRTIEVPVSSTTPRGTPVRLNVHIDELHLITVRGSVASATIDAVLERPMDRTMPTPEEVRDLESRFREAAQFLQPGTRNLAEVRWTQAKRGFDAAITIGDEPQAVHDFEEMEEICNEYETTGTKLDPPKEHFDRLVEDCRRLNDYVRKPAAELGRPHDHQETLRAIDAQVEYGERAFRDSDQRAYADAIQGLEDIRGYLAEIQRQIRLETDTRTETQKAMDALRSAERAANRVMGLAEAKERADLADEVASIARRLAELDADVHADPRGTSQKINRHHVRLEQIEKVLRDMSDGVVRGKMVER